MTVNKCDILGIIFFTLVFVNLMPPASAVSAIVKSEVVGEGFHRTLKYYVDTGNFKNSSCHIAIFVVLPSSLYANVDELADIRRLHKSLLSQSSFCAEGEADVELFAENAHRQNVTICSKLTSTKTTLVIPIHQRYQFSNKDGQPARVSLPRPALVIGCKDRLKEHRVSQLQLCTPCLERAAKWRDIFYKWDGDGNFVWEVPVGNTSRRNYVTYVTLSVALCGATYVLYTIYKSYKKQNKTKEI